ncbi:lipocalin-like domain-containing protein [Cupriavidus metallidurans]|uniref:lipocalin-like domain-containing protein n=1 Tax=Cupriavidus metallidurans TaxID=119219 RepID=UPI003D004B4A
MIAYSGLCRVEDEDKLIIKVDTAWHPAWIGTEQVRFFKVDPGVLAITTAWQMHPSFPGRIARGVLMAQRSND